MSVLEDGTFVYGIAFKLNKIVDDSILTKIEDSFDDRPNIHIDNKSKVLFFNIDDWLNNNKRKEFIESINSEGLYIKNNPLKLISDTQKNLVSDIDFDKSIGKLFFTTYANRFFDDIFQLCNWDNWGQFLIDLGEANL